MFTKNLAQKMAAAAVAATIGLGGYVALESTSTYVENPSQTTNSLQVEEFGESVAVEEFGEGVAHSGLYVPQLTVAANQRFRNEIRSFLNTLPGGSSTSLEWGNPEGHLGGVYIPGGRTIVLNAARLEGRVAKTKDVVRHEIAHIHQNRILASNGMRVAEYQQRLNKVFGSNGIEKSADAVAHLLGANEKHYQSTFSKAQLAVANAILNDQLG